MRSVMRAIVGGHFRSDERGGMSHTFVKFANLRKPQFWVSDKRLIFNNLNWHGDCHHRDVHWALAMASAKQLTLIRQLDIENRSCASRQFANGHQLNILEQEEEGALVLATNSGDVLAFEFLIERYQRRILAVVRRFTRRRHHPATLYKAFVHLKTFEANGISRR